MFVWNTYARLEASIGCRVTAVVSCLQVASIGTRLWGVALSLAEGKELVAHVGVVAFAVKWSIDSAAKLIWADVSIDS